MRTITTTIFSWSHSCLTLNYDYENIESKMRVLAAWNNYRSSGAREENSLRDFSLEKLYDRWAIMLVTLIYLLYSGPKKGLVYSILSRGKCVSSAPYATENLFSSYAFLLSFLSAL